MLENISVDSSLFVLNRLRLIEQLSPNSVVLLCSNDVFPKSGDQSFAFKQNPDLFYLTGINQEETYLLLFPNSHYEKYQQILFIKRSDEDETIWDGKSLSKEDASNLSGIDTVFWSDEFWSFLPHIVCHSEIIYLNTNEHERYSSTVAYADFRFMELIKAKFPLHHYKRLAPIMRNLRAIKSIQEIELITKACNITQKAFERILKFVKPNVYEYQIEAEIIHEFISNRAAGHAYLPIIASGIASCTLHYTKNNKLCVDGEILLLDFGAEYYNYNADLTRTIPIGGRFSQRQRKVYNAVLRVLRQAKLMLKPGVLLDDYNKDIGLIMQSELIDLGLIDRHDVEKQDASNPLYRRYFMHGVSHFLGLDVHDIGDRYSPLQVGNVLTCEPGIYIPNENLGIRLENDILLTEFGNVDLTDNVPIEADHIEELMNS